MRGIVPKNIENCKKKIVIAETETAFSKLPIFCSWCKQRSTRTPFFCMRQKLLKCTNLCAPFPHRPRC